ncbi:hypothetical protein GGR52DRAFT_553908 [Hypoxylon sp. FL1284]|nr:hypothetical protein GGR52DRAFT_553908 [Hypoxylon sp. FL1284]
MYPERPDSIMVRPVDHQTPPGEGEGGEGDDGDDGDGGDDDDGEDDSDENDDSGDEPDAKKRGTAKVPYGPDFLNRNEGGFCRMSDKAWFPVCDGNQAVDNCFNDTLQQLIEGNGDTVTVSSVDPYELYLDWTSN